MSTTIIDINRVSLSKRSNYDSRPCRTGDGDSAPISLGSLEEDTAPLTEKSTTSMTSIPESDEEEESKRESLLDVKAQVSSNE